MVGTLASDFETMIQELKKGMQVADEVDDETTGAVRDSSKLRKTCVDVKIVSWQIM
jgi:DNA-binding ferritin-like protein